MLSCHSVYGSCQRNIHCWLFSSKVLRCVFRSASRAFCFFYLKRNLACASFLSSSLHSSKMNKGWCGQWVTVIHKPLPLSQAIAVKAVLKAVFIENPFYISVLWKSPRVQQSTRNFLLFWLFRYQGFTHSIQWAASKRTITWVYP